MKLTNSALIRGYAKAMFSIAKALQAKKEVNLLLELLSLIIEHPLIQKTIAPYGMVKEQQNNLLLEILRTISVNYFSTNNLNSINLLLPKLEIFIHLLSKQKKLHLIPKIYEKYDQLNLHSEQQMRLTITSAINLDLTQKAFWQNYVHEYCLKHFNKKPLIKFIIDSSITGGAVISYNHTSIDYSIKGRLLALKHSLTSSAI